MANKEYTKLNGRDQTSRHHMKRSKTKNTRGDGDHPRSNATARGPTCTWSTDTKVSRSSLQDSGVQVLAQIVQVAPEATIFDQQFTSRRN